MLLRRRANQPNRTIENEKEEEIMKKIIVGFASLIIAMLPCKVAFAYGHANSFGGSSSHSYGSSSHSNAYGGSTSYTA